jgi:hypothetical protein
MFIRGVPREILFWMLISCIANELISNYLQKLINQNEVKDMLIYYQWLNISAYFCSSTSTSSSVRRLNSLRLARLENTPLS